MQGSCAREDAPWLNRKIRRTPNSRPVPPARFRVNSPNSREFPGPSNPGSQPNRANLVLPVPFPDNRGSLAPLVRFPASPSNLACPGPNNQDSRSNRASPGRLALYPVNPASLGGYALFLPDPSRPLPRVSNPRFRQGLPEPRGLQESGPQHRVFPEPNRSLQAPSPRPRPV